jgi:hypothetical protein
MRGRGLAVMEYSPVVLLAASCHQIRVQLQTLFQPLEPAYGILRLLEAARCVPLYTPRICFDIPVEINFLPGFLTRKRIA